MSCVVSKLFKHNNTDMGYLICDSLKTYGLDEKFYVCGEYFSAMQGTVRTSIALSLNEAEALRNQLNEFIEQNK